MRTMAVAIAFVLAAVVNPSIHSEPDSGYTTVVLEYIGKTNRPIFPIIISSSAEEAQWYRQELFSEPISTLTSAYIVKETTWKEVVDIPFPKADLKQPSAGDGPISAPMLRLVLAKGHDFRETTIGAEESVLILDEIKQRVSEYRLLVRRLSEVEDPMSYYLKQSR
jgi:hypothetical protein